MASIASSCRASARVATRIARNYGGRRAFKTSSRRLAAHNFTMPALSPTMTEGNIASWKLKEGDSFSAGDVILEVETDKATMDVEAQDDGVLAKIMQPDGSKSVKVGSRIAVLAEPGDDLSSLEIPAADPEPASSSKQDSAPSQAPPTPEPPQPAKQAPAPRTPSGGEKETTSRPQPQKYPLYPSVQHLLHVNHLSADQIPASGPNGRLLKGDVLAFLKQIPAAYPQELSDRLGKLSHLDLSSIKAVSAPPTKPADQAKETAALKDEKIPAKEKKVKRREPKVISRPVSLAPLRAAQLQTQEAMGIAPPPLNQLLVRAFMFANESLPPKSGLPTADELFDALVGSPSKPQRPTRGSFIPTVLDAPILKSTAPGRTADPFDDIVGSPTKRRTVARTVVPAQDTKIFSLSVEDEADEKRAKLFLDRVKLCVENEPARLVQFWPDA